jgi:hypothetical protein
MITRIEEIWAAVAAQTTEHRVFRRVDENHPLDLYAGINQEGHRVLLLVTNREPPSVPAPGAVEGIVTQREDGAWAVIVQLARSELAELFGRLCQDLVETTRSSTREHGGEALVRRLHRWRKLLEPGRHTTLSERELRGLLGELWLLDTLVLPRLGLAAGVQAWLGPLGAPQDFLIGGSLLEVKTVQPGAQTIPISSLEQLDSGATPLVLGVVALAPVDAMTGALTPASVVTRIRAILEEDESARTEFELRLADAGYVDGAEYVHHEYRVIETRYFRIGDGFPRLTRGIVPRGVERAAYEIGVQECAPYVCSF